MPFTHRSHLFGLAGAMIMLGGCPAPDGTDSDDPILEDACADYTWETVGGPYTRSWCTGCHGSAVADGERAGAPVGVDFDDEDGVRDHWDAVQARAVEGEPPSMPPGGGPSAAELEAFDLWMACLQD